MVRERLKKVFPSWQNALLALVAAGLLILAFPDFEYWWLAWFALVPLMWAVERERSAWRSFLLGWLFGTAYLFGTCWWLTYAPIHYAAVPWPLAYLMIFVACLVSGLFPGLFAAILAILLKRFGTWAFLAAPFGWIFSEFLRYWLTGNDWNAIGYSQAFTSSRLLGMGSLGGPELIGFLVLLPMSLVQTPLIPLLLIGPFRKASRFFQRVPANSSETWTQAIRPSAALYQIVVFALLLSSSLIGVLLLFAPPLATPSVQRNASIVAVQPNVPASGLDQFKWQQLRDKQFWAALAEIDKLPPANRQLPAVVVFPESPMNFAYEDDREFHKFINDFAVRNNVSVLFNSSEPDKTNGKYFNSAVMVGPDGEVAAEYDKIYLLPFGEAVPFPFEGLMPAFVGSFSYGSKYDLVPLGDAKAGVMICFESHFGELSRRYVQGGADAIIEMTNDGYLGPTPVLRQHLANAVFRAVETNRPVLRVTNVGITAYIDERGNVHDPLPTYTEGTRVWTVSKSDGSQTFYVKYGDWFAWLCTIVTVGLLIIGFRRRRSPTATNL